MSSFQVAELQARARRAARDLAQRIPHCSPDELEALEEQEVEVRYRFRCIRRRWTMRCGQDRSRARDGASKKVPPRYADRSLRKQAS